eukprot:gene20345-15678_t
MEKVRPTLEGMPEELVISILAFLDSDSLAKTSEVCKWLYYLCNDEQIWIRHCRHAWIMQQRRENLLWSDTLPALLGGELKFNAANEVEGIVEVDGAAAAAVDGMAASKWKKAFGLERKDRSSRLLAATLDNPFSVRPLMVVKPEHQGKRLGSTCLAAELEALGPGTPVLLATQEEKNVRFYSRLGFRVHSEEDFVGADNRTVVHNWFMVRGT